MRYEQVFKVLISGVKWAQATGHPTTCMNKRNKNCSDKKYLKITKNFFEEY